MYTVTERVRGYQQVHVYKEVYKSKDGKQFGVEHGMDGEGTEGDRDAKENVYSQYKITKKQSFGLLYARLYDRI